MSWCFLLYIFKVLALSELVKLGQVNLVERMLKVSKTLETNKTGTASGLQTGVVMAEVVVKFIFISILCVNISRCCSNVELQRLRVLAS